MSDRSKPQQYGANLPVYRHRMMWALIVGSLLASGFCAAFIFGTEGGVGPVAWVVFFAFIAVFASGLYLEAQRDPFELCSKLAIVGLVAAALAAIVLIVWPSGRPIAGSFGVIAVAVSAGCLTYSRRARGRDPNPNFLRANFDDSLICERDGIQFVLVPPDEGVTSGDTFEVRVVAQNCMDAPRKLRVLLKPLRMASIRRSGFLVDENAAIELPPRAAGRLTIPVRVSPQTKGLHIWRAVPTVTGSPGRRVLLWAPRKDLRGLIMLTLTALGLLRRHDEPRFQIRTQGNEALRDCNLDASEPRRSRAEILNGRMAAHATQEF